MVEIIGAESHVDFRADVVVGDNSWVVGGAERHVDFKSDVAGDVLGGGKKKKQEKQAVKEYPPPLETRRVMKRRYTKDGRLIVTAEPSEYYVVDGSDNRLRLHLLSMKGGFSFAGEGSGSGTAPESAPEEESGGGGEDNGDEVPSMPPRDSCF
ncbi:unnamed protein product [Cuscuta campestris]|uniref:Uncharacterized protein n=1 Tax=Cuscuta campestris TaxID=132261 RepID=A0A484LGI8_9ASTE|nr:unnamed protein product [Cuscuta campestris]